MLAAMLNYQRVRGIMMMMSENGVSIPQLTILFGELDDSASNFGDPVFRQVHI